MERVYEIGRVFRNEGLRHQTQPGVYPDGAVSGIHRLPRHDGFNRESVPSCGTGSYWTTTSFLTVSIDIDLSKPFERITMVDAVKKYANVDFNEITDLEEARAVAREHHIEFEERHKKGDILNLFFEEFVEEHLIQPTFVMDHPIEISPLTKKKPENPEYVERFEFFMNGWEMANAYSELNDPIDQRERFKAQEELLAQGDDEANTHRRGLHECT